MGIESAPLVNGELGSDGNAVRPGDRHKDADGNPTGDRHEDADASAPGDRHQDPTTYGYVPTTDTDPDSSDLECYADSNRDALVVAMVVVALTRRANTGWET